jgi:hypothetical protein
MPPTLLSTATLIVRILSASFGIKSDDFMKIWTWANTQPKQNQRIAFYMEQ